MLAPYTVMKDILRHCFSWDLTIVDSSRAIQEAASDIEMRLQESRLKRIYNKEMNVFNTQHFKERRKH